MPDSAVLGGKSDEGMTANDITGHTKQPGRLAAGVWYSPSLFLFRSFCFVPSSCRFPFVSCIAFFAFLFFSLPCFPWWRILLFCYSRRYTPPALLASLKDAYSPCVLSLLASLMLTYFLFFLSSLPSLFGFRYGHRLFHPVFFWWVLCCLLGVGFCCDSFSI